MSEHELVGTLVNDWAMGIIYRVASVDEDAFPAEREVQLQAEWVKPIHPQAAHDTSKRTPGSIAKYMAGPASHSIAWCKLMGAASEVDLAGKKAP